MEYVITALDNKGAQVEEQLRAGDENDAIQQMHRKGYVILRLAAASVAGRTTEPSVVKSAGAAQSKSALPTLFAPRVPFQEVVALTRQLSVMIETAVPLDEALAALAENTDDAYLREAFQSICENVSQGRTLSQALGEFPRIFPKLYIDLVNTAEVSGDLDRTLSLAAEYLETMLEMQRKVRGAMTYPAILFLVAVGVIIFMLTYLLPQFRELFTKMNASIPMETKILFALSDFLVARWYVLLAGIVSGGVALRWFASTRQGGYQISNLLQKIPILGDLLAKIAISRQIRSLGTLLESGVGLLVALSTAAPTAQNVLFEEAMMGAWQRVNEGTTLHEAMRESGRFPSMVCQMVAVGEKSGRVGNILLRMAAYYEREVDARLKTLSTVLEPLMIVFLGIVVGFLAVSIISPIYSLVSSVK